MPIYEYKCKQCGAYVEKRQSVSDEPLKVCESCGGELEKQWSRSGIQFKGDGWYVTDYASKKAGGKVKSSGGESTTSKEPASNTSSEKPAAKPDPGKASEK